MERIQEAEARCNNKSAKWQRKKSALVGTRTQDPSIKSAVLYQLSYERSA